MKTKILKTIISTMLTSSICVNYLINYCNAEFAYDSNSMWHNAEDMPTARSSLASISIDDKIYCISGANGSRLNVMEVYNTKTNTWETKAPIPTARSGSAIAVVDNKIYVIGGYNGVNRLNVVEVYNPLTDTWETKTSMPSYRNGISGIAIGEKIYVIGGNNGSSCLNTVEVYDTKTDSWETKTSMPTSRTHLTTSIIDGNIYCIGGWDEHKNKYIDDVEVYDIANDSWMVKSKIPTPRYRLTSKTINNKIYCIGGYYKDSHLNNVEIYDVKNNTWELVTPMPTSRVYLSSSLVDGRIYCIGGENKYGASNKVEVYTPFESIAEKYVLIAENTSDISDINVARTYVNQLLESELKRELQNRLNSIPPSISLEAKNTTSNLDIYIKSENILQMSLDTNQISFDDFSGIEDMEKINAVNVTINSSLPYQINAYLPSEIQNADKTKTLDKSILNIKENSESTYQAFASTTDKIVLKDNCSSGNQLTHGVDLKLAGGIAHEKDVYKATIKLEAEQK